MGGNPTGGGKIGVKTSPKIKYLRWDLQEAYEAQGTNRNQTQKVEGEGEILVNGRRNCQKF